MKRENVLGILSAHHQDLKNLHVKALALFGSVARDEARADSDVDLLVEFEGAATFDRYMATWTSSSSWKNAQGAASTW